MKNPVLLANEACVDARRFAQLTRRIATDSACAAKASRSRGSDVKTVPPGSHVPRRARRPRNLFERVF